jgi:hypothetical protein
MQRTNFDALASKLALGAGLFGVFMGASLILALLLGEAIRWVMPT